MWARKAAHEVPDADHPPLRWTRQATDKPCPLRSRSILFPVADKMPALVFNMAQAFWRER
jgi:hypothetical protein